MDLLFCHKCSDLKKIQPDYTDFQLCKCGNSWAIMEDGLRVSERAVVFEINTNSLLRDVKRVIDGFKPIPGIVMQYKDSSEFERETDVSESEE